jgi:CDP-glucose 4,6-dehydratase
VPDAAWLDRPVLVTGATGLLGGHLVAALLERGARVAVFVRDQTPDCMLVRDGLLERCVQVRGDLGSLADVERALQQYETRALFHLGAQAIVGTARRSPWQTFEDNVRGTWNVLEAARRAGLLEAIVFASSDKAYGPSERLPYTEAHPLGGVSPYDASKSMADLCARSYAATYGLPLATVRCGNLYGPGDLHFNRLIPEMIRARLRGATPVIRSSGRALRDYLYVGDAVEAYLAAAERAGDEGIRGEAFNISTGRPWTVLEVAARVDAALGIHEPPHEIQGRAEQEGEIPAQSLDSAKARRLLEWEATTDLERGLATTATWYRGYFAG